VNNRHSLVPLPCATSFFTPFATCGLARALCATALIAAVVVAPAPSALAKKKPKPPKKERTASPLNNPAKSEGAALQAWVTTAQTPTPDVALVGKLVAPALLLDGVATQLHPLGDGVVGLTDHGVLFKVNRAEQPTVQWRYTVLNSQQRLANTQHAVLGHTSWLVVTDKGQPMLAGVDHAAGRITQTVPLPATGTVYAAGNKLLVMGVNGHLWAIDPTTLVTEWDVDIKSPVIAPLWVNPTDDSVLVADLAGIAHKLRLSNGAVLWRYSGGGQYEAMPLADATAVVLPSQVGSLFGVNRQTGDRLWSHTLPEGTPFLASPVINPAVVVVANQTGLVFALDRKTNRRLWQQRLNARIDTPLLAVRQAIIAVGAQGVVTALNPQTGQPVWQVNTKSVLAGPAVVAGHGLWLVTLDGRLLTVQ
jgi:outer membrane protein assembly factor BamB